MRGKISDSGPAVFPAVFIGSDPVLPAKRADELVAAWPDGKKEYLDRYREACITTGSKVSVFNLATDTPRTGEALGINDDFSLQVRFDDTGEEEAVRSGEVSVRGLYGYT